jgi:hypothetical protein
MKRFLIVLAAAGSLLLPGVVEAADHAITGGSNGSSCGSGGYFTPSSLSVTSGDTVTISVPSNDPYAYGLEVHGFPEGKFTILPGHSHKTAGLTANVSYYGTWPSSGCMKGSGSITVAAAMAHTPTPTAVPANAGSHATPTPTKAAGSPTPTPKSSGGGASPSSSPRPSSSAGPSPSDQPVLKPAAQRQAGPTWVLAAAAGGISIVILLGFAIIWFLARNKRKATFEAQSGEPPVTPPTPPPGPQPPQL